MVTSDERGEHDATLPRAVDAGAGSAAQRSAAARIAELAPCAVPGLRRDLPRIEPQLASKECWMPYLNLAQAAGRAVRDRARGRQPHRRRPAATAGSGCTAQRVSIAGTHPSWAKSANRAGASSLHRRRPCSSRVYLAPRDAGRARRLATEVSTPGSALYRHFLTPAAGPGQVRRHRPPRSARSSPGSARPACGSPASATTSPTATWRSRGSLAAASRAFDVTLRRATGWRGQGVVRAPEQAASAPAGVASLGAVGQRAEHRAHVHEPPMPVRYGQQQAAASRARTTGSPSRAAPTTARSIATNKPTAYGKHWPWAVCGYTPAQVRGPRTGSPRLA